jgi:glycosyltransferase involved in cell wall biosynthesis
VASNDAPLLLDVTRLVWRRWDGRRPTGVDRVCLAYLEHFGPDAQAVVHHHRFRRILDVESSRRLFDLLSQPPPHFRKALVGGALRRLGGRPCAALGRIYLNIGHTGLDSDGFRSWVQSSGVRPVYFVHDLIPVTHPQFCRPGEAGRHRRRIRTVLETGCGVIANSRATLDELGRFARADGLAVPPATAAWLGTTPLKVAAGAAAGGDRPFFVALGTIEARKNHLLLLRIWSRLARRLGRRAPRLFIIGQRGWEAGDVFAILDGDEQLRGHVVELNGCSDDDVASYLASARALLFPSKAEGFGLPLVEALAAGAPVIASELPVFREVGQGVPTLVGEQEDSWEAAILDFARPESAERAAQLERMKRFRAPEWRAHFAAVEQWLTSLDRGRAARSSTEPGS